MEKLFVADDAAIEAAIATSMQEITSGASQAEVIAGLHNQGFAIIDAIKIVRRLYGLPIHKATDVVIVQPAWASEARSLIAAQEQLVDILENEPHLPLP